jgi:hypothetical protein
MFQHIRIAVLALCIVGGAGMIGAVATHADQLPPRDGPIGGPRIIGNPPSQDGPIGGPRIIGNPPSQDGPIGSVPVTQQDQQKQDDSNPGFTF